MKVAVLGSGNGGCAVAYDNAAAGHEVAMFDFPEFSENVAAIAQAGGIRSEGQLQGFAQIDYAGHDLRRTLRDAELIYVVGPAFSTRPFGEACRSHLVAGQTVVVCPGSVGGAAVFKNAIELPPGSEDILVADTSTLPYAVRLIGPGHIRVFLKLKGGLFLAAFPSQDTETVLAKVRLVYPHMTAAKNILHTALQNSNPVLHPPITLLNAARIESTGGDFCFYEDGVTPAVGRLLAALDRERIALGASLGLDILSDPDLGVLQGYMQEATYVRGYNRAQGFQGILAPSSLDHRYFHEDVGYGLVVLTELGESLGVPTPTMNAVINLVSTVMDRDYRGERKRTLRELGLDARSVNEWKCVLSGPELVKTQVDQAHDHRNPQGNQAKRISRLTNA